MNQSSAGLQDGALHWKFRETSAMYEALVEQIPAVIYVDADDEASSALYMSPQVEEMLGYTQEEWLADPDLWVKLLHPEDRERALAEANHARITGELFDIEYRLVSRDGREMWVHDKAARVEVEGGAGVVWQGILLDITERKRVEEELSRSEELFRRTFESAGVGMAHVTPDGRWLRVNDKLCEISGYSHEELVGISFLDMTSSGDRQDSIDRFRRVLGGGLGPYSVERRYIRKDGSRIWVNLSVSLVCQVSGDPNFLICVAEDITVRKLKQIVPDSLTSREMEILRRIAGGQKNQQISKELAYSLGTVKLEVRHILCKLGVGSRREAVHRSIELGLTTPPHY